MRVLLLGSDSPLGHALSETLTQVGRHQLVPLTRAAARWKSERQAKKAIRKAEAELVLDIRVEAVADGGQELAEIDLARCRWISKCCNRDGRVLVFVSSSRVFSGRQDRPYTEQDAPDSEEEVGQLLAAAEGVVREICRRHLILRLGPVFAGEGANLVTHMLGEMVRGEALVLDNHLRGCPVDSTDGARVLSGLVDQLSTGAELWGTYHYCSSETSTYYEFAEAVLAAASQFTAFAGNSVELRELEGGIPNLNRALDCSRIRNTFAIKQLPWRGAIGTLVKRYFQEQSQGA